MLAVIRNKKEELHKPGYGYGAPLFRMFSSLYHLQNIFVNAQIPAQFRVECNGKLILVLYAYNAFFYAGKNFNAL